MLKLTKKLTLKKSQRQPPSGGCVLKHFEGQLYLKKIPQPPSGGCVLKPNLAALSLPIPFAAAFGWLCVETIRRGGLSRFAIAAAFGWLCVETTESPY